MTQKNKKEIKKALSQIKHQRFLLEEIEREIENKRTAKIDMEHDVNDGDLFASIEKLKDAEHELNKIK